MSETEMKDTNIIPVVPLRGGAVFPGITTTISIGRRTSLTAAQTAVDRGGDLLVLVQYDADLEDPKTKDLLLHVEDIKTGKTEKIRTQLAILSEAVVPSARSHELADVLGINTDKRGFFSSCDPCGDPIATDREGIFLCGCSSGPKDITDSIAEENGLAN